MLPCCSNIYCSNIYEIISRIQKYAPTASFLIDEAWSSAFYFHPTLYKYTAGYAAKKLKNKVNIVATQSAHKSLMALRQASFIHSFADNKITESLYKARFKYHSTSPNYAILASMDLARAHMQKNGEKLLGETLSNATKLRKIIKSDPQLAPTLNIESSKNLFDVSKGICVEDPLKVHINIKQLNMSGSDLQEYLYHHHGIYFNRYTETTALINIHIGITKGHIDYLLQVLRSLTDLRESQAIAEIDQSDFIISYPPGIPLYAPGEQLNESVYSKITNDLKCGINVFQLA